MMDMNEIQTRAFNIYMESATIDNGFTPMSAKKIAEQLQKEGLKTSKSAVGRWTIKWKWKELLEKKISATIIEDGSEAKNIIEKSSIDSTTQKTIDDFKANENLKSDAYLILQAQMKKYQDIMANGKYLTHDDEKFVLKVLEVTANREDKLLDRQALISASKLTKSEDVLKALSEETIDVEVED